MYVVWVLLLLAALSAWVGLVVMVRRRSKSVSIDSPRTLKRLNSAMQEAEHARYVDGIIERHVAQVRKEAL